MTGASCHSGSCTGGTPVTCEPCAACVVGVGCVTAPSATCSAPSPGASGLALRNGTDPHHARIGATWRSDAGGAIDFGNPVSSDDYALCLFDESSATPALLFSASAPAGGTCAGKPCWTAHGTSGFAYSDPDTTPDGLRKLRLTKSTRGHVKLSLEGAGPLLSGRPFGLPSPPLSLPLRMELRGENGMCLGATFGPGDVLRNVTGEFKARTP